MPSELPTPTGKTADPPGAYLVFEGGGAKGLVHVGALRAIEELRIADRPLAILGASGTSAGAIMAALVAAGYKADDLFAPDGSRTLLTDLGYVQATDLFGREGWHHVAKFRQLTGHFGERVFLCTVGLAIACSLFAWWALDRSWNSITAVSYLAALATAVVVAWRFRRLASGLASTDNFAKALNHALAVRTGRAEADQIRFSDLPLPLKVVATRLDHRTLRVFSTDATPDCVVADAVAASIAIPVVFEPKQISINRRTPEGTDKALYYDGGLVSNLPAWGWDEERALVPEVFTIAVEIEPGGAEQDASPGFLRQPFANIVSAIVAGIFGAGELNKRGAGRLVILATPTDLDVLEFDMTREKACRAVENAYNTAKSYLTHELQTKPELLNGACKELMEAFAARLAKGTTATAVKRAYLAVQKSDLYRCLKVKYFYDPTDGLHDEMILPLLDGAPKEAMKSGHPAFETITTSAPTPTIRRWRIPDPSGMTWRIAVPIFNGEEEAGNTMAGLLFVLDGNGDPDYAEQVADAFVDEAADSLRDVLALINIQMPQRRST